VNYILDSTGNYKNENFNRKEFLYGSASRIVGFKKFFIPGSFEKPIGFI